VTVTETETTADASDATGTATSPVGATGRRWPLVVAVAAAIVLGLVAVVLALLLARDEDPQRDLRVAAGSFGEVLVTYDHQDPQRHRQAVLDRATGSFAAEYEEAFDSGLGQLIEQLEASSQGFVKDVYTTEVQRGQALAIVVLDVETTGTGGPRRLFDVYVRLTMLEVDGEWLVDDVADLSFGAAGGGRLRTEADEGAPASTATSLP